jgi:hypothetical protein
MGRVEHEISESARGNERMERKSGTSLRSECCEDYTKLVFSQVRHERVESFEQPNTVLVLPPNERR